MCTHVGKYVACLFSSDGSWKASCDSIVQIVSCLYICSDLQKFLFLQTNYLMSLLTSLIRK